MSATIVARLSNLVNFIMNFSSSSHETTYSTYLTIVPGLPNHALAAPNGTAWIGPDMTVRLVGHKGRFHPRQQGGRLGQVQAVAGR